MRPTRGCGTGGYAIRPYRPVVGFLVGAACMAAPDCRKTSLKMSVTEQRGKCEGGKSPLRVQSTRIFKLFRKFKNTHSVAKRLFRHAGAACMAARTGSRFAAGLESSVRRPRVQGIPMTAVGVGRHAHMPPGPGALCSGPRWLRGLVMAGCVRRGCVRRGGAARADMKSAPTDPLSVSS